MVLAKDYDDESRVEAKPTLEQLIDYARKHRWTALREQERRLKNLDNYVSQKGHDPEMVKQMQASVVLHQEALNLALL